ncbi:tape measure protein [Shinella sp. BYT-45]|uniref:tape measure protein n=1 Tax=Shinella sp. BYT-45 TaxID=3377377 RepID=UPI003981061C
MATDIEKLVVQLSADIKQYQREMQRAQGVTNAQARAIENRYRQMDRRLAQIGTSAARSLTAPLAGIAAAVSVKEVLAYADAWTSAKNSLAVAGVVGDNQVQVLDRIYESSQKNATPLGAMADLFGKAAQASDNLGASQEDLLKFADGVGVALRVSGSSASQASGALTQLGQLLGSARVQAEEFNSVNEGARPILIAVANGLDEAGGSVNKLKQLVNDGKVSGQQFFQAFLKGLPSVEKMAANATQTIDQGITKVNNAFTKYIGQTDEGLGASQRLVQGLNALADNFDETADVVLKVASVIAGALVGRSIGLMVAKLGLATSVVVRFVAALRAAATVGGLATAIGGLSAAAGPLGLVIGGTVVGALALFSSSSAEASQGAQTYAEALAEVERRAKEAAPAIEGAAEAIDDKTRDNLIRSLEIAQEEVARTKAAALEMFAAFTDDYSMSFATDEQKRQLRELAEGLDTGKIKAEDAEQAIHRMATANYDFRIAADKLSPLIQAVGNAVAAFDLLQGRMDRASGVSLSPQQMAGYRQYGQSRQQGEEMLRIGKAYADEAARQNSLSKEQLAIEKEIATIKKDVAAKGGFLNDADIRALAERNIAADAARNNSGKTKGVKQTADSRFDADIQAVRDRTAALIEEQRIVGLSYREQERRRMALDLEQSALADLREEARRKGQTDLESIRLSDQQIAKIREASAAYAEQADVLRRVQEEQQRAEDAANEFYDAFKSETIDAITGAKSLSEALGNIAKRLGDLLLNSAFDALFQPKSGSSSGGIFGSIFNALGGMFRAAGGPVKKGQPYIVGEKRPELFVPEQSGTIVPKLPSAPTMPNLSGMVGGSQSLRVSYAPVYNVAQGADPKAIAELRRAQAEDRMTFEARTVSAIRKARSLNVKV